MVLGNKVLGNILDDPVPKVYAAMFRANAAMMLFAKGLYAGKEIEKHSPVETPDGKLIAYNIFRADDYAKMMSDEYVPMGIKQLSKIMWGDSKASPEVKMMNPHGEEIIQLLPDSLKGVHVIRTPKPYRGEILRNVYEDILNCCKIAFYDRETEETRLVLDNLIFEDFLPVRIKY